MPVRFPTVLFTFTFISHLIYYATVVTLVGSPRTTTLPPFPAYTTTAFGSDLYLPAAHTVPPTITTATIYRLPLLHAASPALRLPFYYLPFLTTPHWDGTALPFTVAFHTTTCTLSPPFCCLPVCPSVLRCTTAATYTCCLLPDLPARSHAAAFTMRMLLPLHRTLLPAVFAAYAHLLLPAACHRTQRLLPYTAFILPGFTAGFTTPHCTHTTIRTRHRLPTTCHSPRLFHSPPPATATTLYAPFCGFC